MLCKRCALQRLLPRACKIYYRPVSGQYSDTPNDIDDDGNSQEEIHAEQDGGSVFDQLYPGHIQTTFFQKSLLAFGSAATALMAPWRGDMVSTMGEVTGQFALQSMRNRMLEHPTGRQILEEKPAINSSTVDLSYLKSLPEETFGKAYSNFLETQRVHPDGRSPVQFVDDVELAYVMNRYRQVHDLYHTLLGMPTSMLGEIVVKWVEGLQTGLPMCVLGAIGSPIRLGPKHKKKYLETHMWWAIRNGYNASFYMNVYFEKHWETPVDELRNMLNIEPPPPTPAKIWKD